MGVCFNNKTTINNKKLNNSANGFDFEEILDNFTFYINIPEEENIKIICIEKENNETHNICKKNKKLWNSFLKEIEINYYKKYSINLEMNNLSPIKQLYIKNLNDSYLTINSNAKNKLRKKLIKLVEIGYEKNKDKLIKNLSGGPPNKFRWLIWMGVINSINNINSNSKNNFKKDKTLKENKNNFDEELVALKTRKLNLNNDTEYLYKNLLNKNLNKRLEEQINKDLHRTAPDVKFFQNEKGMKSLFNILKALAIYDEEVSYCQGINLIAANILLVSDMNEIEAFNFIIFLFHNLNIREFYKKGFPNVHLYNHIIKQLLKTYLPKIFQKIEEINISDDVWLFKWVQSIFALTLDFSINIRLWDCLIAFGLDFIFNFALGFLSFFEKQILKVEDMVEFVYIFKNFTLFDNKINHKHFEVIEFREKLIQLAIGFKITENEIEKIKTEYYNNPNIVNIYFDEASFYSNNKNHDEIIENKNFKIDYIFNLDKDEFSYSINCENTVGNIYTENENIISEKISNKIENINYNQNLNENYNQNLNHKYKQIFFENTNQNLINNFNQNLNENYNKNTEEIRIINTNGSRNKNIKYSDSGNLPMNIIERFSSVTNKIEPNLILYNRERIFEKEFYNNNNDINFEEN